MKNNIKISLIEFKYTTMYCNVCNKYRKSKKKKTIPNIFKRH